VLDGDDGVVGFVITTPEGFFGRDVIELLVIGAGHRRGGAGRALLRAAVAAARTERVFTSTNRSNQAMRGLLESERWSFSGELAGLDEDDPELVFFFDRAAR